MKGGIIGLCISLLVVGIFISSLNFKCMEVPSCADYGSLFGRLSIVFGPIGAVAGMIIGFVIDRIKK